MSLIDKIRNRYDQHLYHKRYKEALNLKKNQYEQYLSDYYAMMMNRESHSRGKTLNFENPTTFSEKVQWLKLYDQDPKKGLYSDKYIVRQHIKDTIGEQYLNDLISINGKDVFYNAKEIDFNQLPNSFVLKCSHASHFNFIVKDKSKLTKKQIKSMKRQLNRWLKIRYAFVNGLELQYELTVPSIIIEKYLSINDDLPDYKFFCFDGKIMFAWIDEGRYSRNHFRTVFDPFNPKRIFNYKFGDFDSKDHVDLPDNFEEMLEISKTLCEDFKFVRVDLYSVGGKLFFGELTFTSGSGFRCIYPPEADEEIGKYIKIDKSKRDNCWDYRTK